MNWTEIENNCPKAFKEVCKRFWLVSEGNGWVRCTIDYEGNFDQRNLYDFFDENRITVLITCEFDFGFEILDNRYETNFEVKKWYNSRILAEEQAFTKAFEILESKLK